MIFILRALLPARSTRERESVQWRDGGIISRVLHFGIKIKWTADRPIYRYGSACWGAESPADLRTAQCHLRHLQPHPRPPETGRKATAPAIAARISGEKRNNNEKPYHPNCKGQNAESDEHCCDVFLRH